MATEREVLQQIAKGHPDGLPGLFDRHAALFREGLIRFRGAAGIEEAGVLNTVISSIAGELQGDGFDDLVETFYDWIVRRTWCSLMAQDLAEAGGEHLDPELIWASSDPLIEDDLPEEDRRLCQEHLDSCERCRDHLERTLDIPVEIRHAGAPYPAEFDQVIAKALEGSGPE